MNRNERRLHRKHVSRFPATLEAVPPSEWPQQDTERPRIAVYRSRDFLVQVFEEPEGVIRLSVNRPSVKPDGHWQDGITWDELQDIKDRIGYGDFDAIEVYPRQRDVVNVANIRHLWIMPKPVKLAWRSGHG